MMYTMPKNLLSICVNFALATQPFAQNHLSGLFEYHAISYTPKPNLCVARDTVVFEPYAISFFH